MFLMLENKYECKMPGLLDESDDKVAKPILNARPLLSAVMHIMACI